MKQEQEIQVIIDPEGDRDKGQHGTSEKQKEANKANAKRSTGPRSTEGKERSSQNATKTGIFATRARPITRGPFREDEDEFYQRLEELVDAASPRDAIERAVAEQRALVIIRLERFDQVSVAGIEGDSRLTQSDRTSGIEEPEVTRHRVRAAWMIADVLQDEDGHPTEDVDWKDLALIVREFGPSPGTGVKGLWTDRREPKSEDEWRKAFLALVNHFWDDHGAAIAWAQVTARTLYALSLDSEWRAEERIAHRILENHARVDTQIHNRLIRDLERLSKELRSLQERDLSL